MTRQRRAYLVFLALFAVSRVLFHAAGLHFTARHLDTMMHFVGVDLLRDRLLETLLYLHGPFRVKYCCVCAFVVLFVFGLAVPKAVALAAGRRPSAADAAHLFMALNVLYLFTLGVVLDTGETNRYRLATGGLIVVGALLGVRQVGRAVCRRLVRPGRHAAASRS